MTATESEPTTKEFVNEHSAILNKEFLDIQATLEFRFALKRVRDMIITYSQTNIHQLSLGIRLIRIRTHSIWTIEITLHIAMQLLALIHIADNCI